MSRHLLFIILFLYIHQKFGGSLMTEDPSKICDCNCDVQIDVVRNVMEQLSALRERGNELSTEISYLKTQFSQISKEKSLPTSCVEAAAGKFKSGVYNIHLDRFGDTPFEVFCNEETDFGGWLVIQRRINDAVDFYRGWQAYKDGFGDLQGNYWIGLEKLHALTSSCEQELYIEFKKENDTKEYARYTEFIIGSESEGYALKKLGNFNGNAGDSFSDHIDAKFTTHDQDNDEAEDYNCAVKFKGAWWFKWCYWSHLNGEYESETRGINWNSGSDKKIKFVQMLIRPTEKCLKRLSLRK